MGKSPGLREVVVRAKDRLADGREKLKQQHQAGSPGIQVCARLTDLVDSALIDVYEAALDELDDPNSRTSLRSHSALVPHGGYGRRELAPYSDVDLLLLRDASLDYGRVKAFAQRLLADLSDVGMTLGFSVRTPREAIQFARKDPIILTSQTEARYLAGSVGLFTKFMRRFRKYTLRNSLPLIRRMDESRRDERRQYGETVFLLEPNIKRSRGGLRDIHLLRWIGFSRYGESDPARLGLMGVLTNDARSVRKANEFLLRLRNEMHFHSGKPYDVLHRAEQIRIADEWSYSSTPIMIPVEAFMRDYFEHTRQVRDALNHFRADALQRPLVSALMSPLVTQRRDGHYRVGPIHIGATRRGLPKLRGNLVEVLRLMDLANQSNKRIEHRTWKVIRDDMMGSTDVEVTDEAAKRFLALMTYPSRLGSLLRRLHELRVLEKLVHGMDHARCLLQFNRYHQYTVDEHCIRAVDYATDFLTDERTLGRAYRAIKQRGILHLALLIHDLGKGFTGDHSDVGRDLAVETARILRLGHRQTDLLLFLVHKHLVMSHLAFRRDTSDERIILQFATEVGSAEYLRNLFVLTAADLGAVGPGVLNPWKVDVLTDVYRRAMRHLTGGDPLDDVDQDIEPLRSSLRQRLNSSDPWFERQIRALTPGYLRDTGLDQAVSDLRQLYMMPRDQATAWGTHLTDREVTEYTVATYTDPRPGVFHRLTGALTSKGLSILSAQIHTLADGLVLDRFCVVDADFSGPPPKTRLDEVSQSLRSVVENPLEKPPKFRSVWKDSSARADEELGMLPTRVVIDNTSSPECTIVDVFTHDSVGLLYDMTRTLFELNTSVHYAKIGTFLDQVVDVFYVKDVEGTKIVDDNRLDEIRQGLLRAIESRRGSQPVS